MLRGSVDCPFCIAPSVFSNDYCTQTHSEELPSTIFLILLFSCSLMKISVVFYYPNSYSIKRADWLYQSHGRSLGSHITEARNPPLRNHRHFKQGKNTFLLFKTSSHGLFESNLHCIDSITTEHVEIYKTRKRKMKRLWTDVMKRRILTKCRVIECNIKDSDKLFWYCFDNYFIYFVPVFKYCYSDSRNLWTVMRVGGLAL